MRTREKERLEREKAKMEANSRNRMRFVRGLKSKDIKLDIPAKDMSFPELPGPRRKKELHWRKYKNTRRTHLKRRRVLVVETTKKKKEVYTISGLNKSEINKVIEAIARK